MEIERKFKVKYMPDVSSAKISEIVQWYLSYSPEKRLRIINSSQFIITEKSEGTLVREEREYPVSESEAMELISNCQRTYAVEKTRYSFDVGGLYAELDVYGGALCGNIVCEFEFESEEAAKNAVFPEWIGEELTYDRRYRNAELSKKINGDGKK